MYSWTVFLPRNWTGKPLALVAFDCQFFGVDTIDSAVYRIVQMYSIAGTKIINRPFAVCTRSHELEVKHLNWKTRWSFHGQEMVLRTETEVSKNSRNFKKILIIVSPDLRAETGDTLY